MQPTLTTLTIPEKIIIGSDHAAVALRNIIRRHLEKVHGITVEDVGPHQEGSVDYPDYAARVAGAVSRGQYPGGILLCGTGLGMSMAANRYQGIRAALCNDLFAAQLSRRHNDANVLVLGGRVLGDILALSIVDTWLTTPFEAGRHQQRVDKIDALGHHS